MKKAPVLLIGHGSPMNAIERNHYTESWKSIWESVGKPRAILMFSAHWITENETRISTNNHPNMIYDMYWFPPELYQVRYSAPGSEDIAREIISLIRTSWISGNFHEDGERGFDHGVWSTLIHLFPEADIPVICVSLDYFATPEQHFNLWKTISALREQGIMIIWSGNIVHNLRMIDWSGENPWHSWAIEFDQKITDAIIHNDIASILSSLSWDTAKLAHPSYDHLLPLFPLLWSLDETDSIEFFTPDIVMGSLSMRSMLCC